MKKKLLFALSMVALLVCLFAISVSAETVLKSQDTDAYGELSFFDESITVGRTNTANGFNPYMEDGTTYARVVVGDGTTFYTFPTAYVLSNTAIYGETGKSIYVFDIASLNTAMQTATGTNPNWTKTNIYRIEMPANIVYLNGGAQNFYGYSNMIELYLSPNSTTWDTGSNINCLFHSCEKLTTIHNIETFLFKSNNNLGGTFQNCKSLTSLTLGVSPDITKINNAMFYGCTNLVSVNVLEAFPNAKEIGENVFRDCQKLTTISSSRNDGVLVLPYTYYANNAFQNCDSIKAVKFTASSIKMLQSVFHSLDSLEFVSFPRDSKLELPSCEVFSNNAKLKAVAFPDDCTLIPDRGFKNCTALQAVYLPANLYELRTNGWDQAAFTSDPELYFVNDWFNVLDANGDFLLDNFVMPERPDVYYFPSTLELLYGKSGATGFYNCYNINPYLVFDVKLTQMIADDGLLINCGTKGEVKTAVFLGDMTKVCHSSQDSRLQNIQYVFANVNDKSPSDLEIVNNNAKDPGATAKIYFCATGTSYQIIAKGAEYGENLGESHFYSPCLDAHNDATCESAAGSFTYCFCGEEINFVAVEGSVALGHLYDNLTDKYYPTVNEVPNYFANAIHQYLCPQCNENVEREEEKTNLFTNYGYSVSEEDSSIISYTVYANAELIQAYAEYKGVKVNYGLVVSATANGTPLTYENDTLTTDVNTVKIEMSGSRYNKLTVKVANVPTADMALHCNGYVAVNGDIAYLNHSTVDKTAATVTHSSILELINTQAPAPEDETAE